MAFNGTLLTIGTYKFPMEYIEHGTYTATYITSDSNSKRTASGILVRGVVPYPSIKVSFSTIDGLTNKEINKVMSNIKSQYVATGNNKPGLEKRAKITAYIPELNSHITQYCYLKPDMEFTIDEIDVTTIYYSTVKFTFTGYGN